MNSVPTKKTISDSQLTPNTIVMVRGNIRFSRLLKPIQGEELINDQKRRTQLGMIAIEVPYTSIELDNARIVPMRPDGVKTIEEQFVEERFYQKRDPDDASMHYSVINKSPYPNKFYQKRDTTASGAKNMEADQIQPTGELANGLDVILLLRIFASKRYQRKSIGLQGIVLQEPIRYYSGPTNQMLASAGIILHDDPSLNQTAPAEKPAEPAAVSAPAPNTAFATQPAPAPAPMPASTPAPAYMAQPEGPWTCPSCGATNPAGQMFCGNCGTKHAANAAAPVMGGGNPYAAASQSAMTAQESTGIRYDPNSTVRDY